MLPFDLDPMYWVFIGLLLAFVLGMYIYVRKIVVNFRAGIDEGRR